MHGWLFERSIVTGKRPTSSPETYVAALGEAVEPLMAALKYPQNEVRQLAARKLGEINDPRAVSVLLPALGDCRPEFSSSDIDVAESLGSRAWFEMNRKISLEAARCKVDKVAIVGAYDFFIKRGVPSSENAMIAALLLLPGGRFRNGSGIPKLRESGTGTRRE
jgi:hypothetical protein